MQKYLMRISFYGLAVFVSLSIVALSQTSPLQPLPAHYSLMPFVNNALQLDTAGTWLPANGSHAVKYFVSEDGVHKLTYDWLERAGISPSQIQPGRLRLVRDGNAVPLSCKGLEDGQFDENDAIFFIGTKNYGDTDYYRVVASDAPHPQYLNKYSDSSAYWLFLDAAPSPQYLVREVSGNPQSTIRSQIRISHYEPEVSLQYMGTNVDRINDAAWTREDTWIMQFIEPNQTKSLQFELSHYLPSYNPRIRVAVAGYQGPSAATLNHKLILTLQNGPLIDSASFGSSDQVLLQGSIPASNLANGTFRLEVKSEDIQQSFTRCVIDNYEVEYQQQLVAENNLLEFAPPVGSAGILQFEISGITDTNCIVLSNSITGSYRIHPKYYSEGSTYRLVFVDSVSEDTKYYLASISSCMSPGNGIPVDLNNLRSSLPDVDWLAVTSIAFLDAAQNYASFIAREYGVTSGVVTVEDIYDSYSYGVFNPEAIKLYLYDVFNNRSVAEALPYVVFIGDANYNFKEKSPKYGENFVPGYGFPVSDMLFVCFDSLGLVQQANVGRIPVRTSADLTLYQQRHAAYRALPSSAWNKSVILISGGNSGENDAQLAYYRNINEQIRLTSVLTAPFAGAGTHIYKTASPPSPFGRYTEDQVADILDIGGIAISYVGHSATTAWDNGIDDPAFLMDTKTHKSPLVTDFGCSSGKFAKPNTMSFSEKYISAPDAPGLSYIGNASFGYRSTAQQFPVEFYYVLLKQGVSTIGDAHTNAKRAMVENHGITVATKNALQMSTLLGDPILKLPVPQGPDPALTLDDIASVPAVLTDDLDSLRFQVTVHNYGLVAPGNLQVKAEFSFQEGNNNVLVNEIPFPQISATTEFAFQNTGGNGSGILRIIIDPENQYEEIDETNNHAAFEFSVLNSTVKIINRSLTSSGLDTLTVLNPYLNPGPVTGISLESSRTPDFANPDVSTYDYGFITSTIAPLPSIPSGEKRYFRLKLNGITNVYTEVYSIWNSDPLPFYQQDSIDWSLNTVNSLILSDYGVRPLPAVQGLRVVSSGPFDGSLADVLLNGTSVFNPLAVKGFYVAVFQRDSMTIKDTKAFATAVSSAEADSLSSFIARHSGNTLLAIAASADPTVNRDRFSGAFRSIGAKFVDSIPSQGSYALIVDISTATAFERYTGPMEGPAMIDTALSAPRPDGTVHSSKIGPAGKWTSIRFNANGNIQGSTVRIIGIQRDNNEVTLLETALAASIDISHVDASTYPFIILELKVSGKATPAPEVHSWGVDYLPAPELALNYQSVYTERDTVFLGQRLWTRITWKNAGKTPNSTTFRKVEELHNGILVASRVITMAPIRPGLEWKADYQTTESAALGTGSVIVTLDTGNVVGDQIPYNNRYRVPYSVVADSSLPVLEYTFDSVVPFEGDYIAAAPLIDLTLQPGNTEILHADAFQLSIDGQAVDPWSVEAAFTPSSGNSPARFSYTPTLAPGDHEFRLNAVTPSNVMAYDNDLILHLTVAAGTRIKAMYPVPNPFAERTRFIFLLGGTAQPERAEIKVYTVAGRLINKIDIPDSQLRIGQNVIAWNGRDADGDALANGTYFYRLKVFSGTETATMLGKLSILR